MGRTAAHGDGQPRTSVRRRGRGVLVARKSQSTVWPHSAHPIQPRVHCSESTHSNGAYAVMGPSLHSVYCACAPTVQCFAMHCCAYSGTARMPLAAPASSTACVLRFVGNVRARGCAVGVDTAALQERRAQNPPADGRAPPRQADRDVRAIAIAPSAKMRRAEAQHSRTSVRPAGAMIGTLAMM